MEYLELAADPPLDQVVRCFWFLRSDLVSSTPQPVVADGRLEIVLHAAEPFSRVVDGRNAPQGEALLAGQLTAPIYLQQRGPADVAGIRFRTAAAPALIRHPLHELHNQVVSLGEIDPGLRDGLLLALRQSRDPCHRRDALSAVLLKAMRSADPLASRAVRAMDSVTLPVIGSIARGLGTTTRTLERRILGATGLTPRALRQSLRFRRAFAELQVATPGTLTAAALRAGYYDQAHCIREFRQYTGLSPTEFFAQDPALASALVASVQLENGIDR